MGRGFKVGTETVSESSIRCFFFPETGRNRIRGRASTSTGPETSSPSLSLLS